MAHRKRRRRTPVRPANIDLEFALGTLADQTLLGSELNDNVDRDQFILSVEAIYAMRNHTTGEGPIMVGFAHDDYTDAEIEAWIENTQGWSQADLIQQEIQQRGKRIKIVGSFPVLQGSDAVLNEGRPIKTAARFTLLQSAGLKFWAYNQAGAALTTGTVVIVDGHAWLKAI